MSILQIKTDFVGQVSINPRLVRIVTNDNINTVTSLNWLKKEEENGYPIYPTDFIAVSYNGGSNWFYPTIDSDGNITLHQMANPGKVVVSGTVSANDLVKFIDSTTIADVGYKILHGTSSDFGGGGTIFEFSVPGATISSNAIVVMKNQTNDAFITSIGADTDIVSVTFNTDPGPATRCNYIVFVPNS